MLSVPDLYRIDDTEIKLGGSTVELVEDFYCLGSFVTSNSSYNEYYKIRIGKATSVFGRLMPVWKNRHIRLAL